MAQLNPAHWEMILTVPQQFVNDPEIKLGINAGGGGRVGEKYPDNSWEYALTDTDGNVIYEGTDLHSRGFAASHLQMAGTLLSVLSAYAEGELIPYCENGRDGTVCTCNPDDKRDNDPDCVALWSDGDRKVTGPAANFIAENGERLGIAAFDIGIATGDNTDHEHTRAEIRRWKQEHVHIPALHS